MQVGMIGAGAVAQAFARYLLSAGHKVLLSNSRGPSSLSEVVSDLGEGASAATVQQASEASLVVLAVPWVKVGEALRSVPNWSGKILIDATNPFINAKLEIEDLGGETSSAVVAKLAPGAKVVKALNNLYMTRFAEGPQVGKGRRVAFISGDDAEAKSAVSSLLDGFGFAAIDLGSLDSGGRVQQVPGPLAGLDLVKF
jgi:predicted dinucleotide-binding enzyme